MCLGGQIKGMSITRHALDKHLSKMKLDRYFTKLVKLLGAKKIKVIVLSDNFDYILKHILSLHAIKNLKIYSNKLHFSKGRLIPRFPYQSKQCKVCAHCKTKNLLANISSDSIIIYVGDGRSDICPSQYADIVFAKDSLLKYFQEKKLTCFAYKSLKDVFSYFKRSFV